MPWVATPTNAKSFAQRGIMLESALKDAAFVSTGDLERFIDDYVSITASNPAQSALHADALKAGPQVLAHRYEVDAKEAERRGEEQRMQDRVALMQVRPPLVIQQRTAVGEVAIPIARATAAVAKLAPMAGLYAGVWNVSWAKRVVRPEGSLSGLHKGTTAYLTRDLPRPDQLDAFAASLLEDFAVACRAQETASGR